jgi:hypothetical protein
LFENFVNFLIGLKYLLNFYWFKNKILKNKNKFFISNTKKTPIKRLKKNIIYQKIKMDLISKFNDQLNELEVKNCAACNYTMQSQKGHTCWLWNRIILDEDKYLYADQAIEELNLSNEERQKIYNLACVGPSVFVNYFKNMTING